MSDPARINLLPSDRRERQARQRAVSKWVTVCVLSAAASYLPAGALALNARDSLASVEQRIQRGKDRLAQLDAERPALQAQLVALQERDKVLDAIEGRVDWLPLLGAVSEALPPARVDQIEIRLKPNEGRAELRIVGLASSMLEARELVLRLEQIPVLSDLSLNSASPVQMSTQVFRYDITASVIPGSTPKP